MFKKLIIVRVIKKVGFKKLFFLLVDHIKFKLSFRKGMSRYELFNAIRKIKMQRVK